MEIDKQGILSACQIPDASVTKWCPNLFTIDSFRKKDIENLMIKHYCE
jgi:hypothetical protein